MTGRGPHQRTIEDTNTSALHLQVQRLKCPSHVVYDAHYLVANPEREERIIVASNPMAIWHPTIHDNSQITAQFSMHFRAFRACGFMFPQHSHTMHLVYIYYECMCQYVYVCGVDGHLRILYYRQVEEACTTIWLSAIVCELSFRLIALLRFFSFLKERKIKPKKIWLGKSRRNLRSHKGRRRHKNVVNYLNVFPAWCVGFSVDVFTGGGLFLYVYDFCVWVA